MSNPVHMKQIVSDKAFYGNLAEEQTCLQISVEMTEFNFITNLFRTRLVHILNRGLLCYIKMGGRGKVTGKKLQEQDWISPSLSYSVPKMNPVVGRPLNFRRWI